MKNRAQYSIHEVNGSLMIIETPAESQPQKIYGPVSLLDRFKMTSNEQQIGIRFWNARWFDYSFYITNITEGADVTPFIYEASQ